MTRLLSLLGLSAFVLFTSGCSVQAQRQAAPYYTQQPAQQRYTPPPRSAYNNSQPLYNQQQPNYSPALEARGNIVQLALQELGTPYKYGGSHPKEGFDCSGLMTYIHKNGAGVKIPRTAAQQRNRSRTVAYNALQPGDMLFFKTGSKTNHVGVYIGDRKFVHAPNRRSRVKVTSMDNSYWHSKFVKFGTYLDG